MVYQGTNWIQSWDLASEDATVPKGGSAGKTGVKGQFVIDITNV